MSLLGIGALIFVGLSLVGMATTPPEPGRKARQTGADTGLTSADAGGVFDWSDGDSCDSSCEADSGGSDGGDCGGE